MGRKGIKGLKTRVGGSAALAEVREGSHSVTSRDAAGGKLQE